jgi:hypothetical protein
MVAWGSGRIRRSALALAASLALAGCTTERETSPEHTAHEQLLVSTAADRAGGNINLGIPVGARVFVQPINLQTADGKYAVAVIKDQLLRQGARMADDKKDADTIVELRAGALSVDDKSFLIGVPEFQVPVPLAGNGFKFPEIALYKEKMRLGVAKIAATAYSAKDGSLQSSTGNRYGFAHQKEWTVLLFISWDRDDLVPKSQWHEEVQQQP